MPFHEEETCEQYDVRRQDEVRASEALLGRISKKCPGVECGWSIEKSGGCDHMTCEFSRLGTEMLGGVADESVGSRCGFEFCWRCGAEYWGDEGVYMLGDGAHRVGCVYFLPR